MGRQHSATSVSCPFQGCMRGSPHSDRPSQHHATAIAIVRHRGRPPEAPEGRLVRPSVSAGPRRAYPSMGDGARAATIRSGPSPIAHRARPSPACHRVVPRSAALRCRLPALPLPLLSPVPRPVGSVPPCLRMRGARGCSGCRRCCQSRGRTRKWLPRCQSRVRILTSRLIEN